ncbi:MAG TPA: peroxiredoxin [Polyangiaceae bacterium]|jgi:peroxiredoxin Q/BCP|nr:peroxiredoxin [Polyangiaceae bacterium]
MKTTRATRAVKPAKKPTTTGTRSARPETSKARLGPKVGSPAPSFSLPADSGDEISLAAQKGKWVVLYFYPRDNTPGCTRQGIAFQAAAAALKQRGAVVLGVSRDSIVSHCGFKEKQGLRFPLLSDPDSKVHKLYGAYGDKVMYGKTVTGALRTTAIITPDGKLAKVFSNVKVDGHADAVLAALDEAKKAAAAASRG